MFQKEVAQRIVAPPNHPERSRLGVMVQAVCDVELLYTLPASVFVPQPKVEAAVVQCTKRRNINFSLDTYSALERVVRRAFQHRRKAIVNMTRDRQSLQSALESCDMDPKLRPQHLTTQQFINLSTFYTAA
jgi:16S rRNA A1518/A1519 N6-dimethyltransferase RsmA/KsgA/DIM1 with predicted DNA glycosylase/AP lyase activity